MPSAAAARIAKRYPQRLAPYADHHELLVPGAMDAIERQLNLAGLHAELDPLMADAGALGVKGIVLRRLVREVGPQEARRAPVLCDDSLVTAPAKPARPTCARCLRPQATCLCALVRPTAHGTEVLVLQHPQEQRQA